MRAGNRKMVSSVLGGVALVGLAWASPGCATRTGKGAAIGAGSGAAVGAGIGGLAGGGRGAVVGAGVGAAAGAATGALVGRYMDKQQAELQKNVDNAKIERKGDEIVVRFDSAILFDTDEASLRPQSKKDLADFAKVLRQYEKTNLVIEGHTDSTGPESWNKTLSEARANAVIEFLKDQGVDGARMEARGRADDEPVASNQTSSGRQQNRRVEVGIAPNEELRREDAAQSSRRRGETRPTTAVD